MKPLTHHFTNPLTFLKTGSLLCCLCLATWLPAQTWLGNTNDWASASNWNPAQVPTASSVVTIPNTSIKPTIKDGVLAVAKAVKIETGSALFINEGGTLTISNSVGAALENDGDFHVRGNFTVLGNVNTTDYGIENNHMTKVYSTGVVAIENAYVGISNDWNGDFYLYGDLLIGQNGGVSEYGISNAGTFSTQGSSIKIDHTGFVAIENEGSVASFVHWGTMELGNTASIGDYGIGNWGTAEFTHFWGTIVINRTIKAGIAHSGKSFTNNGALRVGSFASVGAYGIKMGIGKFDNSYTGEIEVNRVSEANLFMDGSGTNFENSGTVQLGTLHPNSAKYGLLNVGGYFQNIYIGIVNIENNTEASIFNMPGSVAGLVRNEGLMSLNSQTHSTSGAIRNASFFHNYPNAQLLIGATQDVSLFNDTDAEFENRGTVSFPVTVPNNNYFCIFNYGAIKNQTTGIMLSYGRVFNQKIVQNDGLLGMYNAQNSTNIGNEFVNDGILAMNPAVSMSGLVNHDMIVTPLSGPCFTVSPALTLGTANNFQAAATWYQNVGMTQPAGTYNSATNTFTQQGTTPYLYFKVTNTANNWEFNVLTPSTVQDNIQPSVTCKPHTVQLNANGQATITANDVLFSMADNCPAGISIQGVSATTFQCNQIGANTVTLTVRDAAGNTAACQAIVQVKDAIAPSITCKNTQIFLNAAGTATVQPVQMVQTIADNCGATVQPLANTTFNCAQTGTHTLVLTAKDAAGNTATCTAVLTVTDAIVPTVQCQPVTLLLDGFGQATLSLNQVMQSASDNCQVASTSLSKTAFNCTNVGPNTVEVKAVDPSGNTGKCNATVTVKDAQAPLAKCMDATINLGANGTATAFGNLLNNGSSDNCTFTLSTTPATLSCANVGLNTVTLRATDASGNTATCTAKVTVKDATPPLALCKNTTIFLDDEGKATLAVTAVNNGSSDACGIASMTLSKTQFNCSELQGTTWPVTMTVKDVNNNTATCVSTVTVKDALAPDAICQNSTVELGSNGLVTVYSNELAGESFDNCSVWSYSPIAKVYSSANLGDNNLLITVKDWSNNAATCTATVTVLPYNNAAGASDRDTPAADSKGQVLPAVLFPNPATDATQINWTLEMDQTIYVNLFDLNGKVLWSTAVPAVTGENTLHIPLAAWPTGMYVVEMHGDQVQKQWRLAIQR